MSSVPVLDEGLLAMVEANAWTFGPNATALRVLALTRELQVAPEEFWGALLERCPRMSPLGYWLDAHVRGGVPLDRLAGDFLRREALMVGYLDRLLGGAQRVLLAGHDREIEQLWKLGGDRRQYRYLLLDGQPGTPAPGAWADHVLPASPVGEPFLFRDLEAALDWADALVLAGFILHRQNVLGPPQLRPLLLSARDQVDRVLLTATNERRLTLGEGAPRAYREDFRPYLWQQCVTHLVSEWHDGHQGTQLGWLPLPPELLASQLGETLHPPAL
jgi:hypothetical protein